MGGNASKAEDSQREIAQEQAQAAASYQAASQQSLAQMTDLFKPVITAETQAQQAQTKLGQDYLSQMQSLLTPLVNTQTQEQKGYYNSSQQELGKMNSALSAPENYYSGIVNAANSGDYSKLVQAAGPQLGTIATQMNSAKQQILDSVPAGPARDELLGQLPMQEGSANASALNSAYTGALQELTGIAQEYGQAGLSTAGLSQSQLNALTSIAGNYGSMGLSESGAAQSALGALGSIAGSYGNTGLQQAGAGLSALQGSGNTQSQVAQEANQSKASTMGFLGSILGGTANVATGGILGMVGGGMPKPPNIAVPSYPDPFGGNANALLGIGLPTPPPY